MNQIKKIIIALSIILIFPFNSQSAPYFSYISDVRQISGSETGYSFVFEYWKADQGYEPNPCVSVLGSAGARNCYLQINHFHGMSGGQLTGGAGSRTAWNCRINVARLNSLKEIYDVATRDCDLTLPLVGYSQHSGRITVDECIGIFLTTSNKASYGRILPGGICGIAPPPAGKCYFVGTGELKIDHGALNSDDLNNNVQQKSFEVMCNKDMKLNIRSSMDTSLLNLRPDGSLRTEVKVNNIPAHLGTLIDARANIPVSVAIRSTLKAATDIVPGTFDGNFTLVLTIP